LSPFCHKNTHRKLHAEIKQAVDLPNSREIFPQGVGEQVTAIASFGREKFAETTNVDHPRATPHFGHPLPTPAYLSTDSKESWPWAELKGGRRYSRS